MAPPTKPYTKSKAQQHLVLGALLLCVAFFLGWLYISHCRYATPCFFPAIASLVFAVLLIRKSVLFLYYFRIPKDWSEEEEQSHRIGTAMFCVMAYIMLCSIGNHFYEEYQINYRGKESKAIVVDTTYSKGRYITLQYKVGGKEFYEKEWCSFFHVGDTVAIVYAIDHPQMVEIAQEVIIEQEKRRESVHPSNTPWWIPVLPFFIFGMIGSYLGIYPIVYYGFRKWRTHFKNDKDWTLNHFAAVVSHDTIPTWKKGVLIVLFAYYKNLNYIFIGSLIAVILGHLIMGAIAVEFPE